MHCDVLILGSGPAGYYCALNCARAGKPTILVEKDRLGGTGFRWGCLPVKMMLDRLRVPAGMGPIASKHSLSLLGETALRIQGIEDRIERRLTAAGVELFRGEGRIIDPGRFRLGKHTISAARIVIATGTEPTGWPGVALDGERIISHREVLQLSEVPQHLLILGGDVEGIEFACIFAHLGGRVTVIEKEQRILPGTDADLAESVKQSLLDRGVVLRTGAEISGCTLTRGATVTLKDGSQLSGERVLVTGLRQPNFPAGLERAGVEQDGQKIGVNPNLQTSCPSIYAVGDINGITGMAHAAIGQALQVAQRIAGPAPGSAHSDEADRDRADTAQGAACAAAADFPYPRAIYTLPEIAGAGYQENELSAEGIPYTRRTHGLADTWRGFSKGVEEGFVKVLSGEKHRILGIWICAADASEQASLFGPLLAGDLTLDALRGGLILHPTLGEAFLEASTDID